MKLYIRFICCGLLIVGLPASCIQEKGNDDVVDENRQEISARISQLKPDSISPENLRGQVYGILGDLDRSDDTLPRSLYQALFRKLNQIPSLKREVIDEALKDAAAISDSLSLGVFYLDNSSFYYRLGDPDSMFLRANLAFKIFDALDEPYYAGRGAYNMAVAQYGASDFATAEQSAILALNLLEESSRENKERRIISTYNLLGSIASAMGNYERAIDYREQALNYVDRDAEDRSSYYSIMNNLGSTQIDAGAYREALRYLSEVAEQTDLRESDPQLYAKVLTNQARANFALGNFDSVEANYLEALRINEDIGERISLPRSNYFLAEYYWDQRDTARAREHLQEGKRIALETEELDGLQDILKLQMLVDRENSAQYGLELSELKDSLIQEERLLRDKFARVRYQTDQYIAENQFLSRQRMMWIWVTAGIVLLGMALLVIINQRIRNQKLRFLQQQQEANQEIFNLMLTQNEKIEEGKQEEQKRISEELHDGPSRAEWKRG